MKRPKKRILSVTIDLRLLSVRLEPFWDHRGATLAVFEASGRLSSSILWGPLLR